MTRTSASITSEHREIIFHLGFQKTGTTSIQVLLNENADHFPGVDIRAYGEATKDLRVAGRTWCAQPGPKTEARLRAAVADHIARFRAGSDRKCLISDENILGRLPFIGERHVLDWGLTILPLIEQEAGDMPLRFVFYTRNPEAWLTSLYGQTVKRGRETRSAEAWRAAMPFSVDWADWHARLQSACQNPVTFFSMENDLSKADYFGQSLVSLLGVDPGPLSIPTAQNPALSSRDLRLMRLVNALPISDARALRISEALEARNAKRNLQ